VSYSAFPIAAGDVIERSVVFDPQGPGHANGDARTNSIGQESRRDPMISPYLLNSDGRPHARFKITQRKIAAILLVIPGVFLISWEKL